MPPHPDVQSHLVKPDVKTETMTSSSMQKESLPAPPIPRNVVNAVRDIEQYKRQYSRRTTEAATKVAATAPAVLPSHHPVHFIKQQVRQNGRRTVAGEVTGVSAVKAAAAGAYQEQQIQQQ